MFLLEAVPVNDLYAYSQAGLNSKRNRQRTFDPAVYRIAAVARRRATAQCYYDAINVIGGISLSRRVSPGVGTLDFPGENLD
jgi:hypothetical protein